MTEIYAVEGIEYTASNHRIRYSPEFHDNHGKQWTDEDLAYLCSSWDGMKKADIAMALGRTHGTVLTKAYALKRNGQFDYYKNLGDSP
ncbi:DNA-entry nuclease [Pseudogracilibacillus auburnensis]|uniref:DNA-entry nuclease n=1 Tax=Pseudogracilibacillus auburnensis TaxID=1494959 RepID=UPI001A977680|nr:DNA-entry nuclease [Pseudogracilibacillus auburnensis]MBO1003140.1 hypothetical protein [Pseudogracilibacillus auburnensis]